MQFCKFQKDLDYYNYAFLQKLCLALIMGSCIQVQGRIREQRISMQLRRLEADIKRVENDYKDIFAAYDKFNTALPTEFGFYYAQLKIAASKASESRYPDLNNPTYMNIDYCVNTYGPIVTSALNALADVYGGSNTRNMRCEPQRETDFRSYDLLYCFMTGVVSQDILCLQGNRLDLPVSDITKKADTLIRILKEIKNVVLAMRSGVY